MTKKYKKRNTESFRKEVNDINNGEFTLLGEFKTTKTETKFRHNCEKCEFHEYTTTPETFLKYNGFCPVCNGSIKPINIIKKEVKELVGDEYTVLSNEHKNNKTKIEFRHNCDLCNNHIFKMTSGHFISNGHRCPRCAILERRYTTDDFKKIVLEKSDTEYTVIGDYKGTSENIKMRHNICGHEYYVTPNNFISKNERCPLCQEKSKGNEYIRNYLTDNNINFIKEKKFKTCKSINELPFDFYIKNLNLLIEFDGEQHFLERSKFNKTHEEFIYRLKCDQIKNQWCKDNKIRLIRISYKDFNNLKKILDDIFDSNKKLHPKQYNSVYIYLPEKELLLETGIYKTLPKVEILNE